MDFEHLVNQACQEELLTAQERENQEREDREARLRREEANLKRAKEKEAAELHRVWLAVLEAIESEQPPHSIMVLDLLRLDELPTRVPYARGWRAAAKEAKWEKAADAIAVPAWDMLATFHIGGRHGETYRVVPYELYFGSNGVVYCDPVSPTASGTHFVWKAAFRSAVEVPGVWFPQAAGTDADSYDGRREILIGFARLVAHHSLEIAFG